MFCFCFHLDTVGAHLRLDYTTDEASPRTVESEYHSRKHAFVGPQDLCERNRNGTNLNRLQQCHRGKTAAHRLKSLPPERAVFCLHTQSVTRESLLPVQLQDDCQSLWVFSAATGLPVLLSRLAHHCHDDSSTQCVSLI